MLWLRKKKNIFQLRTLIWGLRHIYAMTRANKNGMHPNKDSDKPGHTLNLIRGYASRMKNPRARQRIHGSDLFDGQAGQGLHFSRSLF